MIAISLNIVFYTRWLVWPFSLHIVLYSCPLQFKAVLEEYSDSTVFMVPAWKEKMTAVSLHIVLYSCPLQFKAVFEKYSDSTVFLCS